MNHASGSIDFAICYRGEEIPISNQFVAEDLFPIDEEIPGRESLLEDMSASADYRLRHAVAQAEGLTRVAAQRLSQDTCLTIVKSLAENAHAMRLLTTNEIMKMVGSQMEIAVCAIGSTLCADSRKALDLMLKLAGNFDNDEVYWASVKQAFPGIIDNYFPKHSLRVKSNEEVTVSENAYLKYEGKLYALTTEEVRSVLVELNSTMMDFEETIPLWLQYPDDEIVGLIASRFSLKPKVLEELLTRSHSIAMAALENDHAGEISNEALKEFFKNDIACIAEVIHEGSTELCQKLCELYADTQDPVLKEIIENVITDLDDTRRVPRVKGRWRRLRR